MKEKDRIVEIVGSTPDDDYASVRDELLRLSGALGAIGKLREQDLRRLAEKGLDPAHKMLVLSQLLLPQVCSIIGRGLTLEEIGLLTGLDEKAVKRAMRRPEVAKAATIKPGTVDKSRFVKVMVPLRTITRTSGAKAHEKPVREPLLAPRELVDRVVRSGYVTEEGRVLRQDYLSLVSGPMPVVYMISSNVMLVEDKENASRRVAVNRRLAGDETAIKAELEIAVAVLEYLKPLFLSESAPAIAERLTDFFFTSYERAIHYASRHKALNDLDTFERIEAAARPLLASAEGLEGSEWIKDDYMRKSVAMAIDDVLDELNAVIQGRAHLLPSAISDIVSNHPVFFYWH